MIFAFVILRIVVDDKLGIRNNVHASVILAFAADIRVEKLFFFSFFYIDDFLLLYRLFSFIFRPSSLQFLLFFPSAFSFFFLELVLRFGYVEGERERVLEEQSKLSRVTSLFNAVLVLNDDMDGTVSIISVTPPVQFIDSFVSVLIELHLHLTLALIFQIAMLCLYCNLLGWFTGFGLYVKYLDFCFKIRNFVVWIIMLMILAEVDRHRVDECVDFVRMRLKTPLI